MEPILTPCMPCVYGQWTDEAGLDAAFGAANAKLTESLHKRQQQMQQQQQSRAN